MIDAFTLSRLDALVEPYRLSSAPGGCAAVAHRGAVIWRSGFGMANLEHAIAHTAASRIAAGSVTKQFTCAALLLMADDGLLSLDELVGRWMPELHPSLRRPTLRQLMTHTGGVRCHLDLAVFSGYAPIPAGGVLRTLQRQEELAFEPGTRASYSNAGYVLLSAVVERASGRPLEEVLRSRLFEPIGMFATELPRHGHAAQRGAASLYVAGGNSGLWSTARPLAEELLGEGGVVTTVDDLLRWSAWLRDPHSPVTLDRLAHAIALPDGARSDYGFGVVREEWRGVEIVNHVGGLPGGNAILATVPQEEIDVALLFNRNVDVRSLTFDVLEVLMGDRLRSREGQPRADRHGDLVGRYMARAPGFLFDFQNVKGDLRLATFGGTPMPLQTRPADDGALPFGVEVGLGEMRFRVLESKGGQVTAIEFRDGGAWRPAHRLEGGPALASEVVRRAPGLFRNAQAAATLRFELVGDSLVVQVTGEFGSSTCPADVLGSDLVRFHDPHFVSGPLAELERAPGDRIDRIVVSMPRTPRLLFEAV